LKTLFLSISTEDKECCCISTCEAKIAHISTSVNPNSAGCTRETLSQTQMGKRKKESSTKKRMKGGEKHLMGRL